MGLQAAEIQLGLVSLTCPGVHVFDHPDEVLEALLAPRLAKAS